MDESNLSSVNAEPAANVEPQSNEAVNNEPSQANIAEPAEPQRGSESQQKPAQSPEENAKYAEVRRKAEAEAKSKARDELISEMYGESHGIHTYAEYQAAIAKQEQEQKLTELLQQNIPEEYAKEMIENRKFREQFEAEQKTKQQQEQQQADMKDFIAEFPNVKAEEIPVEVWQANAKGVPLRYAYADYALKQTRAAEAKVKANAENAKGSMGSVGSNGTANDGYFTKEQVSKMTSAEIARNYEKICESTRKW